jgi:hypothetical protein
MIRLVILPVTDIYRLYPRRLNLVFIRHTAKRRLVNFPSQNMIGLTQLARVGFAYSIQFDYPWQL